MSIRTTLIFWGAIFLSVFCGAAPLDDALMPMEPKHSYKYLLVMSKEDSVCQHMLSVYNEGLIKTGKLKLEDYEEYSTIKWEPTADLLKKNSAWLMESNVAVMDINNDEIDEVAHIFSYYPRFVNQVTQIFYYYPYEEYLGVGVDVNSGMLASIRKLTSLKLGASATSDTSRSSIYTLFELPIQSTQVRLEGTSQEFKSSYYQYMHPTMKVYPFLFDDRAYVSIFSVVGEISTGSLDDTSLISIRQYKPDNSISDICYYVKTPAIYRAKAEVK